MNTPQTGLKKMGLGEGKSFLKRFAFPAGIPGIIAAANALPAALAGKAGTSAAAAGNAIAIGADGWLEVAWAGDFPHPNPQVGTQRVDAQDIQTLLENFNQVRQASGDGWAGIPLYVGHPEVDGTLATAPAYAWFKEARINANSGRLEFLPDWSADGKDMVLEQKKLKFISNYWYYDKDQDGYARPYYIGSVGLTNNPVIRDGQKPVANSEAAVDAPPATESTESTKSNQSIPSTPSTPVAPNATADTPWWQALTGELAKMVEGATDAKSALELLSAKISALYQEASKHERMQSLLWKIARDLGLIPSDGDPKAFDVALVPPAVAAVAASANSATRELHDLLIALAVNAGKVAADAVPQARDLLAANAGAAKATWFPGGNAVQAAGNLRPLPPGDPLAGSRLTPAAGNTGAARPLGAADFTAIAASANAIATQRGIPYEAAHDLAFNQYLQHRQ